MARPVNINEIGTTGATTGTPWLKYDPATNRLVWSSKPTYTVGEATDLDASTPIADGQVWAYNAATGKYVPAANGGITYKTSQTGVVTIHAADDASESIVPGMDATGLAPGRPVSLAVNLWVSQNRPGYHKYLRLRVRDGGLTGGIVFSYDFPEETVDSTAGHRQQFAQTLALQTATGRLCVTLQSITGAATPNDPPAVYSDTRALTAVQGGRSSLRELVDVDLTGLTTGDAVIYNDASGKFEAGTVATGGGGGGTDEVLLLEADQDASDIPPDTPVGVIVFRKVIA